MKTCSTCRHWKIIYGCEHTGTCMEWNMDCLADNLCPVWQQHAPETIGTGREIEKDSPAVLVWIMVAWCCLLPLVMWGAVWLLRHSAP